MIVVNWAQGVNKNVMQSSTWTHELGIIADNTRCGVRKVRANNVYAPPQYSVTMHFTLAEKTFLWTGMMMYAEKVCFHSVFQILKKGGVKAFTLLHLTRCFHSLILVDRLLKCK